MFTAPSDAFKYQLKLEWSGGSQTGTVATRDVTPGSFPSDVTEEFDVTGFASFGQLSYTAKLKACRAQWSPCGTEVASTNKLILPFPALDPPTVEVDGTGEEIVADYVLPSTDFSYVLRLTWQVCPVDESGSPTPCTEGSVSEPLDPPLSPNTAGSHDFAQGDRSVLLYQVEIAACPEVGRFDCGPSYVSDNVLKMQMAKDLEIIPQEQRAALLLWTANQDADAEYHVEVETPLALGTWRWKETVNNGTSYEIKLDRVIGSSGLDNETYLNIRIVVKDKNGDRLNSEASQEITIIDTPIRAANGESEPGSPSVEVKWSPPVEAAFVEIRHRALAKDGPQDTGSWHSHHEWTLNDDSYPDAFDGTAKPDSDSDRTFDVELSPVDPPDDDSPGAVYALQLNYRLGGVKVFSARDAFVWPSDVSATDGQRIANFPLHYPLASETYVYHICRETFPSADRAGWEFMIQHAFDQWEYSIDNVVTIERSLDDCAKYAAFIEAAADEVANLAPGVDATEHVEGMFARFNEHDEFHPTYDEAVDDDKLLNEIRMYDDFADANIVLLKDVGVFHELAGRFGHKCNWSNLDVAACVDLTPYGPGQYTKDLMIRHGHLSHKAWTDAGVAPPIPGGDDKFDDDDIRLNHDCIVAYDTILHELGHVFGISWGREPQNDPTDRGHALVTDSVMNYNQVLGVNEPDCSPYPLDIMAVYAIYQTLD